MGDSEFTLKYTREMYLHAKPVTYEGADSMYMARVELKSGTRLDIPFRCEGKTRPYDFVIHFLIVWLWSPREIEQVELYQQNIYQESYNPIVGWFKRKEVKPLEDQA